MKVRLIWLALGLGVLAALLMPTVTFTLLTGWAPAAERLLTRWHPLSSHILPRSAALLALLTGTHLFLQWLFRSQTASPETTRSRRWPWKWTLAGFGLLTCTLLAVISAVLTTHQIYWLKHSNLPWFSDSLRETRYLSRLGNHLLVQAKEADWDAETVRLAFQDPDPDDEGPPALELLDAIWVKLDEHKLRAVVLTPRQVLVRRRARIMVLQPGAAPEINRLSDLPEVLAKLGIPTADAKHTPEGIP